GWTQQKTERLQPLLHANAKPFGS
ncbi:hypothetical protein, partial [Mycobacterium tuberculosis]